MKVLTLDIGGANIKKVLFSNGKIKERLYYFPIWKKKYELKKFLENISENSEIVAVTTTAELSDIFESKEEGAKFILNTCTEVFENPYFLSIRKKLLPPEELKPIEIAAANFVASICYMEKRYKEGIMVDMGSTTTDIIPFREGENLYGKTDVERILKSQLIYTGMLRTPLNTIVHRVPFKNRMVRISSEFFAITADLYTVLGYIAEYPCDAPDNRGKDPESCRRRIARLLCADLEDIEEELEGICEFIKNEQVRIIAQGIERVSNDYGIYKVYACGIGEKIIKEACDKIGINYKSLGIKYLPNYGLYDMILDKF